MLETFRCWNTAIRPRRRAIRRIFHWLLPNSKTFTRWGWYVWFANMNLDVLRFRFFSFGCFVWFLHTFGFSSFGYSSFLYIRLRCIWFVWIRFDLPEHIGSLTDPYACLSKQFKITRSPIRLFLFTSILFSPAIGHTSESSSARWMRWTAWNCSAVPMPELTS